MFWKNVLLPSAGSTNLVEHAPEPDLVTLKMDAVLPKRRNTPTAWRKHLKITYTLFLQITTASHFVVTPAI
jgi:hypothetical protein